jgi:hypothetical protein
MAQISNIIDGWDSYLKGETSPIAIERAKVCIKCVHAIKGFFEKFMPDETLKRVQGLKCGKCNCPLSAKLRSQDEKCPLNKWE